MCAQAGVLISSCSRAKCRSQSFKRESLVAGLTIAVLVQQVSKSRPRNTVPNLSLAAIPLERTTANLNPANALLFGVNLKVNRAACLWELLDLEISFDSMFSLSVLWFHRVALRPNENELSDRRWQRARLQLKLF